MKIVSKQSVILSLSKDQFGLPFSAFVPKFNLGSFPDLAKFHFARTPAPQERQDRFFGGSNKIKVISKAGKLPSANPFNHIKIASLISPYSHPVDSENLVIP